MWDECDLMWSSMRAQQNNPEETWKFNKASAYI